MAGAPNFLRVIDAYEAGSDRARRSRLQQLDEQSRSLTGAALSGDQNALKELGGVDPNAYMNVSKFTTEQKAQRLDQIASGAFAADTPQKWEAFKQTWKAQGHTLDPSEEPFTARQTIIDQAMGWKEKLAQQNSDRTFNAERDYRKSSIGLQQQEFAETTRSHKAQEDIERGKIAANGPDIVELYDGPTGQPYKAQWNPTTRQYDRIGGIKAPNGTSLEVGPDGTVTFTQGMGKSLTEGQSKDTGYLTRMTEAIPLIDQMGEKLTSFGENLGARAPLVGNYLKSPEYQQAEQAAGQWRQGFLRKDSGATITPDETADTNRLYLPQPGDKAPVLAQKAKARRTATLAVKLGLPPKAVMEMQKAGVDVDKIIGAPLPGAGGKGDQQPMTATNPQTGQKIISHDGGQTWGPQ